MAGDPIKHRREEFADKRPENLDKTFHNSRDEFAGNPGENLD